MCCAKRSVQCAILKILLVFCVVLSAVYSTKCAVCSLCCANRAVQYYVCAFKYMLQSVKCSFKCVACGNCGAKYSVKYKVCCLK